MGNSLVIYLNKRLQEGNFTKPSYPGIPGPVITISREVGCQGLNLAKLIADRLNEHKWHSQWRVLSKEIFYQSAKELDLEPERIRRIFKQTDKYIFDEILKAFRDKQFKSERKIVKTVHDVVRSFAEDGHSIIVGRAAHLIAKDIQQALHIRLIAPLDYRLHSVMKTNSFSREEALAFIDRVEKERIAFRKAISPGKLGEDFFDMVINRASFDNEEIVDIILNAMEKRKLLTKIEHKVEYY